MRSVRWYQSIFKRRDWTKRARESEREREGMRSYRASGQVIMMVLMLVLLVLLLVMPAADAAQVNCFLAQCLQRFVLRFQFVQLEIFVLAKNYENRFN